LAVILACVPEGVTAWYTVAEIAHTITAPIINATTYIQVDPSGI
jgi:hypothetical protein